MVKWVNFEASHFHEQHKNKEGLISLEHHFRFEQNINEEIILEITLFELLPKLVTQLGYVLHLCF